ncbi:MAG: hypothetical protein HGA45_05890 [Chloroflexales bacterium]|nr:hypothetical protein [Chloroflexales bacterium]
MLRDILAIFRRSPGATLTPAVIGAELGVSPALVEHMLRTLVRSGRLVELESGAGCGSCPLERICVGGLTLHERCYVLREPGPDAGPAYQ